MNLYIPNKKCITDTLELIGLSNAGKKRVANFSLGMKQKDKKEAPDAEALIPLRPALFQPIS